MNIYLVPLVQYDRGNGKQGTRPAGVENLSSWSTLRVDDSRILVGTPDTLTKLPTGGFQLASDATEKPTAARLRLFANRLGENIDGLRSGKIADLLLDMHTIGADGSKRKPLIASHRGGKKQLELWLGGQLIAVQAVPAGGAVEFSDNFNRADSSTLGASWNEIAAAGEGAANWAISSNTLGHSRDEATDALLVYDSALSSTDHYCQVDVVKNAVDIGSGEEYGPCVRFDTSGPVCYFGNVVGDQSAHIGYMNTGWTVLASTSSAWSSACTVKLVANGSSLELFVNGVSKVTLTDSSLTTGVRAGVYGYAGYPSEFDNWEAGTSASGVNVSVGNAAATATSYAASVSSKPQPGVASATASAFTVTASPKPQAARAAATASAFAATASSKPQPGLASATGSAFAATASTKPQPGLASATASAYAVAASTKPQPGVASATASAFTVTSSTKPQPGLASATASAYAVTVSTAPTVNVAVGAATATASAYAPAVALQIAAGIAQATATAYNPTASVAVQAVLALATATAYAATVTQGLPLDPDATPYRTFHELDARIGYELEAATEHHLSGVGAYKRDGTRTYHLDGRRSYRKRAY